MVTAGPGHTVLSSPSRSAAMDFTVPGAVWRRLRGLQPALRPFVELVVAKRKLR